MALECEALALALDLHYEALALTLLALLTSLAAYMSQTRAQRGFPITEVAAEWHELRK